AAVGLLSAWRPPVAVLSGEMRGAAELLRHLDEDGVMTVVVGGAAAVGAAEASGSARVVVASVEPSAVADAVLIVAGRARPPEHPDTLQWGGLRLDLSKRSAEIDGRHVELPPKEFALLAELALRPERPIPASELARRAW